MKNKTTLSITLAMGVMLLIFAGFSANVNAQMRSVGETGLVLLAPDEVLVVTVASKRGTEPIRLNFEWTGYVSYAGPGGGPNVKIFEGVTQGDLLRDGSYSFQVPSSFNGATASGVRVDVSCDRAPRCSVSGQIFRNVQGPAGRVRQKTGHVTISR